MRNISRPSTLTARALVAALILAAPVPTTAAAAARLPGELSSAPKFLTSTDVAVTSFPYAVSTVSANGSTFVVGWQEPDGAGTAFKIAVSRNHGLTWAKSKVGSRINGATGKVLSSADGQSLLAVWIDGDSAGCRLTTSRSTDYGAAWSAPAVVDSTTVDAPQCTAVQATMTPDGANMVVGWDVQVFYGNAPNLWGFAPRFTSSSNGGTSWSTPSSPPMLAGDRWITSQTANLVIGVAAGQPMVATAYLSDTETRGVVVAMSSDLGATWTTSIVKSDSWPWRPDVSEFSLNMSADASTLTLAATNSDGSTNRIYVAVGVRSDTSVSWAAPIAVSAAGTTSERPEVTVSNTAGRMAVAWVENVSSTPYFKMSTSADGGGTWGTPFDFGATGSLNLRPAVAASADGNTIAVARFGCTGNHALATLYMTRDAGTNWSSYCAGQGPATVYRPGSGLGAVSMAVDAGFNNLLLASAAKLQTLIAMSTSDIVFSASPAFDLSYDSNDGRALTFSDGGVLPGDTVTARNDSTFAYYDNVTRTTRQPIAWNTRSDGTGTAIAADGSGTLAVTSDTVLYAQWAGAPSKPAAPSAVAGVRQAALQWSRPSGNGDTITTYQVEQSSNGGSSWASVSGCTYDVTVATPSCTVTGLANSTSYLFRVQASNSLGASAWSDPSTSIATPGLPDTPTLTAVSGVGEVSLSWSTPAGNGSALTGYIVEYRAATTNSWSAGNNTCTGLIVATATSCKITGLLSNSSYYFHMRAQNSVGLGAWTSDVPGQTAGAPSAPDAPTLQVDGAQINVSGSAPANNGAVITAYTLQYKTTASTTWTTANPSPAPQFDYSYSYGLGLAGGTSYDFRVSATNAVGTSAFSAISSATTASAPSTPAVPGLAPTPGQVAVSWSAPADGGSPITGYAVQYKLSSSKTWLDWTPSPTATDTSTIVSGLTAGAQYDFRVAARNKVGLSAYSLPNTVIMPNLPSAPTGVTGAVAPQTETTTWTAAAGNGSVVDSYQLQIGTAKAGPFSLSSCVPVQISSTTWSCATTGLSNGTSYYVQVRAHNGVGWGAWSTVAGPYTTPSLPSAPAAPTGTAGNQQVTLTWKAPANGGSAIIGYLVEVALSSAPTVWSAIPTGCAPQPLNALTCVAGGLTNGTGYVFHVRAQNAVGLGPWSATSAIITPRLTAPATVTGITWTLLTKTLSWNANDAKDQVTRYEYVYKLTSTTKWPTTWTSVGTNTSVVLSLLTSNSSYDIRVRAVNSVGAGLASQLTFIA